MKGQKWPTFTPPATTQRRRYRGRVLLRRSHDKPAEGAEKSNEEKAPEAKKGTAEKPTEPAKETKSEGVPEEANEEFSGLVKQITNELSEAVDAGAVEAVLEIYGSQIAQTEGTPTHDQITEAADARREELAQ